LKMLKKYNRDSIIIPDIEKKSSDLTEAIEVDAEEEPWYIKNPKLPISISGFLLFIIIAMLATYYLYLVPLWDKELDEPKDGSQSYLELQKMNKG